MPTSACPICRMVPTDYCFTYPATCSQCRRDHAIRFGLCTACWLASGPTADEILRATTGAKP